MFKIMFNTGHVKQEREKPLSFERNGKYGKCKNSINSMASCFDWDVSYYRKISSLIC